MNINFFRFSPVLMAAATLLGVCANLSAQTFPITDGQKHTAAQIAQGGVALSDLAPNAPDNYTVKQGDTLWIIAGLFLKSPWRWPELWGMNREDINNPHQIFPGQQLMLEKINGRAVLHTGRAEGATIMVGGAPISTLKVTPRTRSASLTNVAIPTLSPKAIDPFLAEPMIVNEQTFALAPRIVATQEERVLLSRGDRAYASGKYDGSNSGKPLSTAKGQPFNFRVFRNVKVLKDPANGEILGYEAQYVGQAELVRGESTAQVEDKNGKLQIERVPATIDIVGAKEEIRVGDRLIPEPSHELRTYVPRAPSAPMSGQIASVYGSAVDMAGENQIVVLNRGTRDGIVRGHVMSILKDGQRLQDKTDSTRPSLKLPNEHNGLLMVFRAFENLSYALILQATDGVKIGDRFTSPN